MLISQVVHSFRFTYFCEKPLFFVCVQYTTIDRKCQYGIAAISLSIIRKSRPEGLLF